jgi:hypothetical protein
MSVLTGWQHRALSNSSGKAGAAAMNLGKRPAPLVDLLANPFRIPVSLRYKCLGLDDQLVCRRHVVPGLRQLTG